MSLNNNFLTSCKACGDIITNTDELHTEQTLFCERCFTISCNHIRAQIEMRKEYERYHGSTPTKTNYQWMLEFRNRNKNND